MINGKDAADGTVVEAYIGNTLCGTGTVQNRNNAEIYLVDVVGAGQKPGCGKDGDTVTFKVAGLDAKETGKYATAAATHLDLTASGTARNQAAPTVLAPGQGGVPLTPIATPNPTEQAAPAETPAAPAAPAATPAAPPNETATAAPAAAGTAAASATPSPAASETATPTETATPSLVSPEASPAPRSSGPSPLIWIIPVVVLVIAAAVALLIYQRRGAA